MFNIPLLSKKAKKRKDAGENYKQQQLERQS